MTWTMANSPTRKRVYRQTVTLIRKNFLIFYRAPISTIIRALVFPVVFTIVICVLKDVSAISLSETPTPGGVIANSPIPIQDLKTAIDASSSNKLVFVQNGEFDRNKSSHVFAIGLQRLTSLGVSSDLLSPLVNNIKNKLEGIDVQLTAEPDDLFALCQQTIWGSSDCFAAVIFSGFNETDVEYTIAVDPHAENTLSSKDYPNSLASAILFPIQWEIDSQVGKIPQTSKPSEQPWSGSFDSQHYTSLDISTYTGPPWLGLIGMFVAPFLILIHIGASYHIGVFVARERETSISALMQAQLVTDLPRVISTILSFMALYLPGMMACSIILTQLLFKKTSDILFLFLTILAGISTIVSSHVLASFFQKAQLAGLYISTFLFSLALVSLAASLLGSSPYSEFLNLNFAQSSSHAQVVALSLIFPPYTWATLIGDVANREFELTPFSLSPVVANAVETAIGLKPAEALRGSLYVVFFIIQIVVYSVAAYWIERGLWSIKRPYDSIPGSSDIAVRCTRLSKTYYSKRSWYWPMKAPAAPNHAVQNLDLEVKKGSVTFLLGPNGGGKTTTLKCIAGMTAMDEGSHLEINETGNVFGICPQHNVSNHYIPNGLS